MSGIAPGAWLGNYNVFPGDVVDARSEDILNAVEAAVNDGMDVLNLSLGGGYRGNNDLLAKGLDNAVAAGVIVVSTAATKAPAASPSARPDVPATSSPSAPARTTTSSASRSPMTARTARHRAGATGDFDPLEDGTYGIVDTGGTRLHGCGHHRQTLTGKIALINRGVCTFSEKVAAAKAKGADRRHRHQQRRRRSDGDGPDRGLSTTTSRRS